MAVRIEKYVDMVSNNGFAGLGMEYLIERGLDRLRAGLYAQGYSIPDSETMQSRLDIAQFHLWAIAPPVQPSGCSHILFGMGRTGKFPDSIPSGGMSFIRDSRSDPFQHPGLVTEITEKHIPQTFSPKMPGRN